MTRSQLLRLPLLIAGLGVALVLSRQWPTDHSVRVVLGDVAPTVDEVRLRYAAEGEGTAKEWLREVTFNYAAGHAPRIVSHEPRLPSGRYAVEIEVGVVTASHAHRSVSIDRTVQLTTATAQVDVASAVRDSLRVIDPPAAPPAP